MLHYTAMKSAADALERLCDPQSEVSAHYLVSERGRVWQLVSETRRAWHAGRGAWGDVTDVNSHSIGIELANDGTQPFPEPQMIALETLLDGILSRWSIPKHRVIGHSDMAIGRKIDPGPRFDWRRLARAGLSIWPETAVPGNFDRDTRAAGYASEDADALLAALRLRFRPWARGPLCDADRAIAADLAARFPARAPAHSTS